MFKFRSLIIFGFGLLVALAVFGVDGFLYRNSHIDPHTTIIIDMLVLIGTILIELWFVMNFVIERYVITSAPKYLRDIPNFSKMLGDTGISLVDIMKYTSDIMHVNNIHLKNTAEHQISYLRSNLAQMVGGQITMNLASTATIKEMSAVLFCKNKYRAVSISDPILFWNTSEGEELVDTNRNAILLGKTVQRIFIHSSDRIPDLVPIIKAQSEIGIEVFFLPAEKVTKRYSTKDFGIVDDGVVGVEVQVDSDREVQRTTFYFDDENFSQQREIILELEKIWNHVSSHRDLLDGDQFLAKYGFPDK